MKIVEIRQMSETELKERITGDENLLAQLKFRQATSQMENPMKIRTVRRGIAKMKTVFRERQLSNATETK
ncbi:MAG: 50S ribosomal protein L29 [Bacteroidota bacterium]